MEEPNIKSKILSFFRVAKSAYHGDERLSRAAGRLYDRFEKAFNDFAEMNRGNLAAEGVTSGEGKRYAYKGRSADGRGIFEANFPKEAKSARILEYIQNVWSKKPIKLVISNGETSRVIEARFDPTVDETQKKSLMGTLFIVIAQKKQKSSPPDRLYMPP